ncbi:hypothetical protein C8035_v006553 [Colletotrichum spinosum]|uniref:Uncharacterized protein n=1 Tax=Colletotrichum spinosum TaxID=1347390 RepID=A0A4R8QIS7_9PEZI|nr:hypothetical protein C8035_v006553 [Colletotrichum spinosum]
MGSNDSSARLGSQTIDFGAARSPSEPGRVESSETRCIGCFQLRHETRTDAVVSPIALHGGRELRPGPHDELG